MKIFMLLAALTLPVASIGTSLAMAHGQGQGLALGLDRQVSVTKGPNKLKSQKVPNRYIVTLEPRADPRRVAAEAGIEPEFVYTEVLTGFAGTMSDLAHSKLRRDNRVVRIEQDSTVVAQAVGSWGLDRIDQRSLPLNSSYSPSGAGTGVTVYIVDTGINFSHAMFAGRAIRGIDVINDGRNGLDCNGHGTHVAGTVGGGGGYGVAPGVTLVAARVLDCEGSGYTSGIIAAMDWIATSGRRPAIANLSLGGSASASMDDAVRRLVGHGVTTVVAAGNDNVDACTQSPARAADAIAVGATGQNDGRASFSNYGSCVDIFAPGVSIISAYYSSNTALAQMSGTSMASPHVAGAAAIKLGASPSLTPAGVRTALLSTASGGVVLNALSPTAAIVFVGGAAAPAPSPTPTPTPTPTPAPTASPITLTATTSRVVIYTRVNLSYKGATAASVDIYRNGVKRVTTANSGSYSETLTVRGTFRYKVCNVGTTVCSNEVSITA